MLVQQQVLSTVGQAFLNKLNQLDLRPIGQRLVHYGWNQEQLNRAIRQYKMFLLLVYLHPDTLLVPTLEVDLIWHCHILHTRKYSQDCQDLFGRFIDHEPESELSGLTEAQLDGAFGQTQALLEQYFGKEVLGETSLEQAANNDKQGIQSEQINPEWLSLFCHRSACGRPFS